jgi:hypothetical protein
MPPTKRKRKTKHRGNAAGSIEARGRTGRKPNAEEQKKADAASRRQERANKPPSWNAAAMRAGFASLLLFILLQIGIGPKVELGAAIGLCAFAMLIYIPLGYATDRWVYNRRMRNQANQKAKH